MTVVMGIRRENAQTGSHAGIIGNLAFSSATAILIRSDLRFISIKRKQETEPASLSSAYSMIYLVPKNKPAQGPASIIKAQICPACPPSGRQKFCHHGNRSLHRIFGIKPKGLSGSKPAPVPHPARPFP